MDRLSALGQSPDRPLVAWQGALSCIFSGGPSPNHPRLLSAFLPRHAHRRSTETGAGRSRIRRGESGGPGLAVAILSLVACIAIAFAVGRFPVSLLELAQVLLS